MGICNDSVIVNAEVAKTLGYLQNEETVAYYDELLVMWKWRVEWKPFTLIRNRNQRSNHVSNRKRQRAEQRSISVSQLVTDLLENRI